MDGHDGTTGATQRNTRFRAAAREAIVPNMSYELRTNVIEPTRNTFNYLVERFGDRPATRYQEASFNVQPRENFHYRPTWDADRAMYDADYTALKLTDPYSYTDPRQYFYTPFVAASAERYESFAQTLKYVEDRLMLDKLPDNWQTVCTGFVIPLRHYESGAQLISINAARFAYGTTVPSLPRSPRWTASATPSCTASSGSRCPAAGPTGSPRPSGTGWSRSRCRACASWSRN